MRAEPPAPPPARRSKTRVAWLALVLGALGVHRWYLRGARDPWAWCFLLPSLAGIAGLLRMRNIGMDDQWGWLLVPMLGFSVSAAMLSAIVIALMPDEKWDRIHNPAHIASQPAGWGAVMVAIIGLLLGGAVFMSTVTFAGQMFFEWERARSEAAATPQVKTTRD
jgi:TM2 domain